jgi:hypothetical protein
MIKKIIRLQNDMVMVFDENGEQLPEYQGYYRDVKDRIMDEAPAGAIFNHWFGYTPRPVLKASSIW